MVYSFSESQSAIADCGQNYGARWLSRLGIRRRRGTSLPTLHRTLRGLDCARLEQCVTRWAERVLAALPTPLARSTPLPSTARAYAAALIHEASPVTS